MKDRVFIAWSGTQDVAIRVKKILESEYNYICSVGGNSDNNSTFASVGDTVIQQIKNCNQAIVIFQNRRDGAVSNNLFFELGYVMAMYGQKKIHCVKHIDEEVVLPSDFDNSFVESIAGGEDENAFARGIVDYFIGRQKMSINENKMFLINNRYMIREKMDYHYSEYGSKCSDYELAQYILYYMQAAQMFGDVDKVHKELLEFKSKHNFEFSSELSLSVDMSISFMEMLQYIKEKENDFEVYLEQKPFWQFKKEHEHFLDVLVDDEFGIFDEWARVFILQRLNFGYMLFGNNETSASDLRANCYRKSKEYGVRCLESIEVLEKATPSKENHDEVGLISLLRAYVYRNLYVAEKYLQEDGCLVWLQKTMKERESLKSIYGKGAIDTQLYNLFCMEYYLSLVNYLESGQTDEIDDFEIMMYREEISDYLDSIKKGHNETAYLHQIRRWCDHA